MNRALALVRMPQAAQSARTFFVTSTTAGRRALLQSDRMAQLLVDVLAENRRKGRFLLHEFAIMPNHFHLLLMSWGRPGIYPRHKCDVIISGFSPWGMLFSSIFHRLGLWHAIQPIQVVCMYKPVIHQPSPLRIPGHVFDLVSEILWIANPMLVKTCLPDLSRELFPYGERKTALDTLNAPFQGLPVRWG